MLRNILLNFDYTIIIWMFEILLLGLLVGLSSSFFGIGGGIFMVPLLPIIFHISLRESIATSLFTMFFITVWNAWKFHKKKLVNWEAVLKIGPVAAGFAFFSAKFAILLSQSMLTWIVVLSLWAITYFVLFVPKKEHLNNSSIIAKSSSNNRINQNTKKTLLFFSLGIFSGILSGLSGFGGGSFLTPLFLSYHVVEEKKATPTANGTLIFTSLFSSLAFLDFNKFAWPKWGLIHINISIFIFIGSLIGSFYGIKYQEFVPSKWRRNILGCFLVILSFCFFIIKT